MQWNHLRLTALLLLGGLALPAAGVVSQSLIEAPERMNIGAGGKTTFTWTTGTTPLTAQLKTDGNTEDFPALGRAWNDPQDWRRFTTLHVRLRLTATAGEAKQKSVALVVLDRNVLWLNVEGQPQRLQMMQRMVPCGEWVDLDFSLAGFVRGAVSNMNFYLYEQPPGSPHGVKLEIEKLELQGPDANELVFDGELLPRAAWPAAPNPARAAFEVTTRDGLGLGFDKQGAIVALRAAGNAQAAVANPAMTGLLVGDATTSAPPAPVGGQLASQPDGALRQTGEIAALGLRVDTTYRAQGDWLEIAGTVKDLRGSDRAVTVYFSLPAEAPQWRWQGNIGGAPDFTEPPPPCEQNDFDTNLEYGRHGLQSLYPMGTLNLPSQLGLTLAVRMDEPVVQRIVWNPERQRFFIAADFGLIPQKNIRGVDQSAAAFRFLLYRHDPAEGMRAAWDRYYGFFPALFHKRITKEGGWTCWGQLSENKGGAEAGLGIDWGPYKRSAAKWDNDNGILTLAYIEPGSYHQTMGDYATTPEDALVIERLQRAADGDTADIARWKSLAYATGGFGVTPRESLDLYSQTQSVDRFIQNLSRATLNSMVQDAMGNPYLNTGKFGWIGDSCQAGMFQCNLDPDIPQGKGRFNIEGSLRLTTENYAAAGAKIDGYALDVIGAMAAKANYRREHFQYCDVPLTFSSTGRIPVQGGYAWLVEWLRELYAHGEKDQLVIMGNCGDALAAWYSYGAPYLDVLGAEAGGFGDPAYSRAISKGKTLTHLTYGKAPRWKVQQHLLHNIYPGQGDPPAALQPTAALHRELSAAEWQPLTHVRNTSAALQVERFGGIDGKPTYLVYFNTTPAPAAFPLEIDTKKLGAMDLQHASTVYAGEGSSITLQGGGKLLLRMKPLDTLCLFLPASGSPTSDYEVLRRQLPGLRPLPTRVKYLNDPADLGEVVADWTPAQMSTTPKPLEWDVTRHLTTGGTYSFTFIHREGESLLDIHWLALIEKTAAGEREVVRDTHKGAAGLERENSTYRLPLAAPRAGATYLIRGEFNTRHVTTSAGDVRLKLEAPASEEPGT